MGPIFILFEGTFIYSFIYIFIYKKILCLLAYTMWHLDKLQGGRTCIDPFLTTLINSSLQH